MKEKGKHKTPNLKLYKSLLKRFRENKGDKEIELRLKRYVRMLSDAYTQIATNKLKSRFRMAVQSDDLISLYSLSLALQKKQIFSFSAYEEGVITTESLTWLKQLSMFLHESDGFCPGTKEWCEKITPLLDTSSTFLSTSLQIINELQWDYYLSTWEPYQAAIEADRYNLHSQDPRLCLLACWAYNAPVYLN